MPAEFYSFDMVEALTLFREVQTALILRCMLKECNKLSCLDSACLRLELMPCIPATSSEPSARLRLFLNITNFLSGFSRILKKCVSEIGAMESFDVAPQYKTQSSWSGDYEVRGMASQMVKEMKLSVCV
jgi:hypothetical protein